MLLSGIISLTGEITEIFDTPTAVNPERGSYALGLAVYDDGGISLKMSVGINRFIHLGAVEYVDGLLGKAVNKWHYPSLTAKLSVLGRTEDRFNFALGWDALSAGSFSDFTDPIYGPYFVFTKGFSSKGERAHLFSVGGKVSITSKPYRFYFFTSLYLRVFRFLDYGLELDGISFTKGTDYHIINNHVLSFVVTEEFHLKFIFQVGLNFRDISKTKWEDVNSRSISFTFQNFF